MADKKFDLGDYVEVKDRIKLFYELFGQGRLVTGEVRLTTEPDGVPRVMVQGLAYRTPDDTHPGQGWSWMALPGTTSYTKGSELENVETSAWGRAIGSLGILIDRSIASSQEVQNKQDDRPSTVNGGPPPEHPPAIAPNVESETLVGIKSIAGTVRQRDAKTPLESREGPDGHVIVFRLETAKGGIPQVVVQGPAGEALYLASGMKPASLVGNRIEVKGRLFNVTQPQRQSFYRLHVTEWSNADYAYPAKDELPLEEPPDDLVLLGEDPAA